MENDYIYKKLKTLYTEYNSIEPPALLIKCASEVIELITPFFKDKYGDDFHVSMGYYFSDIAVNIGHFNSYVSRGTLFYNLYLTEFIADYLFYLDHKDNLSFNYLYGKQMRNFELKTGNNEAATFYNRMYSIAEKKIIIGPEYKMNAIWISVNIIFHELAHSESRFIELIREVLKDIKIPTGFPELKKKEEIEIEIACDFISAVWMDPLLNEVSCTLSKDAILGISASVILMVDLYKCLPELTINKIKNKCYALNKIDDMANTLVNRTRRLMVLFVYLQKNDVLSRIIDWSEVLYYLKEISGFLDQICFFYANELRREIRKFDVLSKEEKLGYHMEKPIETWFYYQD